MKYLFVILAFCACTSKQNVPVPKKIVTVFDTIPVVMASQIEKTDTVFLSCKHQKEIDSLKTQLTLYRYKVARIKYYVGICQRNPKQTKFLLSWVHRTIQ